MKTFISIVVGAILLAACGGGAGTNPQVDQLQVQAKKPCWAGKSICPPDPTPTPTPDPTPTPTPVPLAGSPQLGVNIEGLADYARMRPYVDLMRTARKWGSFSAPWDENTPTDANGWPTGDAGIVMWASTSGTTGDVGDNTNVYTQIPQGTYALAYTGSGTVVAGASPGVTVTNQRYDAATNRTTADVVVGSGAYQMILYFQGTNGGVKNMSLRRPGYASTDIFTDEFKNAVAPFGTLRLMSVLGINNSTVRTWAQRTTPASATQTRGAAYEYAIEMANLLGKDIWINVPYGVDDDFIRQLATLMNTQLAPDRVVYIEYSNELWNSIFQQTTDNMTDAVNEAVAGDTSLVNGATCTYADFSANVGACNPYWAGYRRVGKMTVHLSRLFAEVMGASAFGTRFRPVLATQWADRNLGEQQLKYIARYHGDPKTLIYGIAGAPYFGLGSQSQTNSLTNDPSLTVDSLLQYMQDFVTWFYPQFKPNMVYSGGDWQGATQKSLADYYGIQSMAYEGGQDLGQTNVNLANKTIATKDPRMGNVQLNYWSQWFGCGNGLFMQFALTSDWGDSGYWGLTNNPADLSGPKFTSAVTAAQNAATYTTCN